MEIRYYHRPETLDEAAELTAQYEALVLGGGAWVRNHKKYAEHAVDPMHIEQLRHIEEYSGGVRIGAMVSLREMETSDILAARYGSSIRDALQHIVGVQMRNIITAGGSTSARLGFSDVNTLLTALEAMIVLRKGSEELHVPVEAFLRGHEYRKGVFVTHIEIPFLQKNGAASFASMRRTFTDISVLNCCAVFHDRDYREIAEIGKAASGPHWHISIGSRPAGPVSAYEAAELLGESRKPEESAIQACLEKIEDEMSFGSNIRGSGEYRKHLSTILVKRAIQEVME